MTFEIFKHGHKVGEIQAQTALEARLWGESVYGGGGLGASLKEEPDPRIDVTQLHTKPENAASASPNGQNPEVAGFETKRAIPHATNGEGTLNRNGLGSTPHPKRAKLPIDAVTHPKRRKGKFTRKQRESRKRCQDKQRYPNSAEAHKAIRGLVKRTGRHRQKNLHAYKCRCGSWHIHS